MAPPEVVQASVRRGPWHRAMPYALGLGVAGIYLLLAWRTELPGIDDGLVFYHVAGRLLDGNGLTLPYIWTYLPPPSTLTPPAFGYWMPGATYLAVVGMGVLGRSALAALAPWALLVGALAATTFGLARALTGDDWLATLAALVVPACPRIVELGTQTDSTIPCAALGAAALICANGSLGAKRLPAALRSLLAGGLAGLAYLCRGDGLLILAVVLGLAAWRARAAAGSRETRTRLQRTWATVAGGPLPALLGFVGLALPWLIRTRAVFGQFTPPGAAKGIWVVTFEDIHSLGKTIGPRAYLAHLSEGVGAALRDKVLATALSLEVVLTGAGALWPLAIVGAGASARSPEDRFVTWLAPLYLAVLVAFYGLLATEIGRMGSLVRSSLVTLPFLAAAAARGVQALEGRLTLRKLARLRGAGSLALMTAVLVCAVPGLNEAVRVACERDLDTAWIADAIQPSAAHPVVVMSRKPWQVYEQTGFAALQIPNDDLETVFRAAITYGASHLHLRNGTDREALAAIYDGSQADDRLELIAVRGAQRLYRLALVEPQETG